MLDALRIDSNNVHHVIHMHFEDLGVGSNLEFSSWNSKLILLTNCDKEVLQTKCKYFNLLMLISLQLFTS